MKTFMKKSLAVLLAVVMLSSSFVCFAAELNQDAVDAHYGQYKNYLLLGDSVASGYRDQIADEDYDFNEANNHTTYYRVPGSYADILANAIIEDGSMEAYAAPGFRTIEMRYMLEDDFAATYEDEYLFHPSQLYVYDDQVCDCCNEVMLPGSEHFRKLYKQAIADADLITLGVGGNDWGAYLTWVLADIFEAENVADKYIKEAEEILRKSTMDIGTIETLIDLAHKAGALEALLTVLPQALKDGLTNFYNNWELVIKDIYALNPDVTLMVLGMSDNSLKGKYYDYNGVEGGLVNPDTAEEDETKAKAMEMIVGFIMGVGNGPMIEFADDYGYRYVDTDGTTYVDSHPDAAGHVFIANKIIEALPNADIFNKFEDVKPSNKYYDAVEYVVANGLMTGREDGTFDLEAIMTKGEFAVALNKINGTDKKTDKTDDATAVHLMFAFLKAAFGKGDAASFFKTIALAMKVIADNDFDFGAGITRADAAEYLKTLCTI